MIRSNYFFFFVVMVLAACKTEKEAPVDDVLHYMRSLGNGSYLFGQMGIWVHDANPDLNHSNNWIRKVHNHSGKMPKYGCITYDFVDNPYPDSAWNQGVKKMWEKGMIPGIYNWWKNPSGGAWNEHCNIDQILSEDPNPTKTHWYKQMDRMAKNLRWLENQGIAVIYTPFVELDNEGKWFGTDGKENAIKLHRLIHDYFENTKGLNNIIWAYHTGSSGNMKAYYPGDEYVDIMGHSVYHKWGNPDLNFYDYSWAVEKKKEEGKIIWMAELGINSEDEPERDCFNVLERLENDYPELAGFVFWGDAGYFNIIGNKNGSEFMSHPKIVTLKSNKEAGDFK